MGSAHEEAVGELRQFGARETLRETGRLLRDNASTFLRVGLAAMTPGAALEALAVFRMQAVTRPLEVEAFALGDTSGGGLAFVRFPYLLAASAVAVVGMLIAQGAMTHTTSEALAGRRATVAESLAKGFRCLGPLVAQHAVVSLLVLGGLLLLVVPGIFAVLAYFLVYGVAGPAVVVEGASAIDALDRSSDLTRGHRAEIAVSFVPIALVLIALAALSFGATGATLEAARGVFAPGSFAGALFATLAGILPEVTYVAVATTYWVVVYARARRSETPSSVTGLVRAIG